MENNFNKEKFSEILNKIYSTYSNQRDFANAMGISRGYLSQYINMKLKNPPTPKILEKIAENSNFITSYNELMNVCGYTSLADAFFEKNIQQTGNQIPIISEIEFENNLPVSFFYGTNYEKYITANFTLEENKEYFAYQTQDDSMLPLLGIGDIAIIEKTDKYESGNTCLISLDNKEILIRKIVEYKDYIELQTAFPYAPYVKIANDELEKRNFKILRKSY